MKRLTALTLLLCLLCAAPLALATELSNEDILAIVEEFTPYYSTRYTRHEAYPPFVRTVYKITFTDGLDDLPEAAQKAYGDFLSIICIEIGMYVTPPIVQSDFLAAGIKADGSMLECPAPTRLAPIMPGVDLLGAAEVEVIFSLGE